MTSLFVSYSHRDEAWKDRLLRQFAALERQGLGVAAWHDRTIAGGGDWEAEIRTAMAGADAAILLISTDFLASKFIHDVEVPYLLERRKVDGLPVIPVVVSPCNWRRVDWLKALNLRPPDGEPLSAGTDHQIEAQLAAIADEVVTLAARGKRGMVDSRRPATRDDWLLVHPYGMPPHFTGRLAERRALSAWLERENGPGLLVLRALGGFGKSALVWHWLWNDVPPERWPRVVWWSFYDQPSFDESLAAVLGALGQDANDLRGRLGVTWLVDALRRSQVLLVLDGFERALRAFARMDAAYRGDGEEDEQRLGEEGRDCVSPVAGAFLRALSAYPSVSGRVLLTTRLRPREVEAHGGVRLVGCVEIELDELAPEDAIDFFHAAGVAGTRTEIEAAGRTYGFHPLSLRLLAGLIVKDLRQPGDIQVARRLDVSGDLIQRKHHVLEQSYASLPVEERRLLSRIACFRGAMRYEALVAAGGGIAADAVDRLLLDLVDRGLLQREERAGRFDLHPIVRRYAYDRLGEGERQEAHRTLRDYFAAVPPAEPVKIVADLDCVIERYHHMVQAGEYDAAFELLYEKIFSTTHFQLGEYGLNVELLSALFRDGENAAPKLKSETQRGGAYSLLAMSLSFLGQPNRAIDLYEKHNQINQWHWNRKNLGIGLASLACSALFSTGRLDSADQNFRRAIRLQEQIGDRVDEAISRLERARLLVRMGHWGEAENELARATATVEEKRLAQVRCVCAAYSAEMVMVRSREREPAGGSSFGSDTQARRALEIVVEIAGKGVRNERDFVRAHWLLGAALRKYGEDTDADRHLGEALERCRRINMVDYEADILIDLGRLRLVQGDAAEARRLGVEAQAIAARCGYVLQEADARLLLAGLDRAAGDRTAALEHAREARRLATCDGPPDYTYKVAYDEAGGLLAELEAGGRA